MPSRVPIVLLLLACACAHTQQPKPQQQPAPATPPKLPGQPPLAIFPSQLFVPGGVEKIQEALTKKGFPVKVDGVFGEETQKQLLAFQKQQHLPETGLPSQEVVKKLGLDPKEIFKSSPEAKQSQG